MTIPLCTISIIIINYNNEPRAGIGVEFVATIEEIKSCNIMKARNVPVAVAIFASMNKS